MNWSCFFGFHVWSIFEDCTVTRKYVGEMEPRHYSGQMRKCSLCGRKQFKRIK